MTKLHYLSSRKINHHKTALRMPLIENEPHHSRRMLIFLGVPSILLAIVLSSLTHQYGHAIAEQFLCSAGHQHTFQLSHTADATDGTVCPIASLVGAASTFFLALVSFALLVHNPRNIFVAAMAFVSATWRLPETLAVFAQMTLYHKTSLIVDESIALQLIRLKDATGSIVLLCFYSIVVVFFSIIIIHDTKFLRWKWSVAAILLSFIGSMKYFQLL